jgi:hypothetical protein
MYDPPSTVDSGLDRGSMRKLQLDQLSKDFELL